MAFNFNEVLSKPADAVEKPKPLPVGHYICAIDGQADYRETKDGKGVAEIKLKPLQPDVDVDPTALAEMGGLGNRTLRHSLWLEEDSLYRIKEFGATVGIEVVGKSIGEIFAEFPGRQCRVKVKHVPSKDGSEIYANVESVGAI